MDADPIPPQSPQVVPVPTPLGWGLGRVGHVDNGEPLVLLKLFLVTGEVSVFIPASAAKRLGAQLTEQATGIHLAGGQP